VRGWPSEYLRAMIFFSFCCLFAAEVAAGIVVLAEGTRSSSWSIVRHVRIEKRVIDSHRDHDHSGNHAFEHNFSFPRIHSSISFFPLSWSPSLVALVQPAVFLYLFFLVNVARSQRVFLTINQTTRNSVRFSGGWGAISCPPAIGGSYVITPKPAARVSVVLPYTSFSPPNNPCPRSFCRGNCRCIHRFSPTIYDLRLLRQLCNERRQQ